MRITNIETIVANGGFRNWLFVKVETDQPGLYGWGEATLEWKTRAVAAAVEDLKPMLLGHDPHQINHAVEIMKKQSFWRLGVIGMSAVSGIEMALWDILGKDQGVPVWQLFGGRVRDRVKVYTHLNMGEVVAVYDTDGVEPLKEHAQKVVDNGYRALKVVIIPFSHYGVSVKQVNNVAAMAEALRETVGDDFDLMFDFHGRPASAAAALAYIEAIAPIRPLFVEEPVQPGDAREIAKIREKTLVPIATGERLIQLEEFAAHLEARAVDYLQPDICHCGGLSESRKIAAMAEAFGVGVAPHNPAGPIAGAAALHFALTTPNHLIQEEMVGAVPWYWDIMRETPVHMENGYWQSTEAPGLGVDIDVAVAKAHPFVQEEFLSAMARMPDGTQVDW